MRVEGISTKDFRRALEFVADHATVFIDVRIPEWQMALVSYDAFVLLVAEVGITTEVTPQGVTDTEGGWAPCIPQHYADLLKAFMAHAEAEFTMVADPETDYVGFISGMHRLMIPRVPAAVISDYRAKVPAKVKFSGLNPRYLTETAERFIKATDRVRVFHPRANEGVLIEDIHDHVYAVVMPMRSTDPRDVNLAVNGGTNVATDAQPATPEAPEQAPAAPDEFPA